MIDLFPAVFDWNYFLVEERYAENRVASRMRFLRYLALICFCSRISSKYAGTRL